MSWEFCIRSSPTLYKYVHVNVIAKKPRIKLIITVCYLYLFTNKEQLVLNGLPCIKLKMYMQVQFDLTVAILSLQYLDRFDLSPTFTIEEFRHWFIPRPGIVDTYVVEVRSRVEHCVMIYGLGTLKCQGPHSINVLYHFGLLFGIK